jgi:kynureninase
VDQIRKKSLHQTKRIFDLCDASGYKVQTPRDPEKRGGTVVVDLQYGDAIVKELTARNILVDYRPGAGIRISPHFYTSDSEIEETFGAIEEILKTKSYEKHLQQRGSLY